MNKESIINEISSYSSQNKYNPIVLKNLISILYKIPDENLRNTSYANIKENEKKLTLELIHANDNLRIIKIIMYEKEVVVITCFMRDSLRYQYFKNKNFNSIDDLSSAYFNAVFSDKFSKKLFYKNAIRAVKCEFCFEDKKLKPRSYIKLTNRVLEYFFGKYLNWIPKEFEYLSFFEKYDYSIPNEFINN
jgi:hypothetical protein